jgi:hypothetical protein
MDPRPSRGEGDHPQQDVDVRNNGIGPASWRWAISRSGVAARRTCQRTNSISIAGSSSTPALASC